MDGKIKYKESDSRSDLRAILRLTVAEKFEELCCDGDLVVQFIKWTFGLTVTTHTNEHSIKSVSGYRKPSYQVPLNA